MVRLQWTPPQVISDMCSLGDVCQHRRDEGRLCTYIFSPISPWWCTFTPSSVSWRFWCPENQLPGLLASLQRTRACANFQVDPTLFTFFLENLGPLKNLGQVLAPAVATFCNTCSCACTHHEWMCFISYLSWVKSQSAPEGYCKISTGHSPTDDHCLVVLPLHPITALVSGSSNYVVCPWSTLLSVFETVSFQGHVSHIEAAAFKAPELLQRQRKNKRPDASQVRHVVAVYPAWESSGKGLVVGHHSS